jgi:hypothetical protein
MISSACTPLGSTSWRIRGVVFEASGRVIVRSFDALLLSPNPNGVHPSPNLVHSDWLKTKIK